MAQQWWFSGRWHRVVAQGGGTGRWNTATAFRYVVDQAADHKVLWGRVEMGTGLGHRRGRG